jgi:hypothetical protein
VRNLRSLATIALISCSEVAGPEGGGEIHVEPTLPDIWEKVFVKSCAFSVCHSEVGEASGLVLAASQFAKPSEAEFVLACTNLVQQPVENVHTDNEIRVIPGDAHESFLVKVIEGRIDVVMSGCSEEDCNCPMPYNNTCSTTMPPGPILAIRAWIDGLGAADACNVGRDATPDGPAAAPDMADDVMDGLVSDGDMN